MSEQRGYAFDIHALDSDLKDRFCRIRRILFIQMCLEIYDSSSHGMDMIGQIASRWSKVHEDALSQAKAERFAEWYGPKKKEGKRFLSYVEAMELLRSGKCVQSESWIGSERFLFMNKNNSVMDRVSRYNAILGNLVSEVLSGEWLEYIPDSDVKRELEELRGK